MLQSIRARAILVNVVWHHSYHDVADISISGQNTESRLFVRVFSLRVAAAAKERATALAAQAEQALSDVEASVRGARLAAVKLRAQDAEVAPRDLHKLAAQQLTSWHAAHSDAAEYEVGAHVNAIRCCKHRQRRSCGVQVVEGFGRAEDVFQRTHCHITERTERIEISASIRTEDPLAWKRCTVHEYFIAVLL